MKNYFSKKVIGFVSIAALLLAANFTSVSWGQQVSELFNVVFRNSSPQIRYTGTLSFTDLTGTVFASLNQSTGALAGTKRLGIVTAATTRTLTAAECGAVIVANHTTATQVFTLPAASTTGCMFTFIAGHADTEIQFKSAAVATCVITHFAAVGADADTAIVTDTSCEGGIKNTAGSNAIGDSITIISDGTRWLGVGIASGIWAVV